MKKIFRTIIKKKERYGIAFHDYAKLYVSNPYKSSKLERKKIKLKNLKVILPCKPSKIICAADNYYSKYSKNKKYKEPYLFLKSPNALSLDKDKIRIPDKKWHVWGEPELGIVIKKKITFKTKIKSLDEFILGYLVCNDVTSKNIIGRDHHLVRSKSADGFCPVSKYIYSKETFKKNDVIIGYVNDKPIRSGKLSDRIFSDKEIIKFLSKWFELLPGDIVLTGAPVFKRKDIYLKNKDVYRCKIGNTVEIINSFHT